MEDHTKLEHPWEDDDELEEGLIGRRNNSKNHNQKPINSNGQQQENVVKHFNGIKIEDEDEDEKHKKHQTSSSEYCVYYDTKKGIWKCRICSWDNRGRTCFVGHNQDPKRHSHRLVNVKNVYETEGTELQRESSTVEENIDDSTATAHGNSPVQQNTDNPENGNGVYSLISNQNGEHQKHDNFCRQPSDISFEELEKSSSSYINNKPEITEIEAIKDGVDELAEFDVETVIKKQETHDLFCPNCNSCITKRVILRKRKRRVPVPGEDTKRNKPETRVIPSEAKVTSDNSSYSQARDVQTSESTEYDHQREPDVFRCLSCFSIFMPTGNGFKLFRLFGNKRSEELNQQFSQKDESRVKKCWFLNIFASDNAEQLDNQGVVQSSDAGNNNVLAATSTTVLEEKANAEFVPSSSFRESKGRELEKDRVESAIPSVSRDGDPPSSTQGSDIIEQRVVEGSDNTLNETNGKIVTGVDTHDQLLTPYHTEPNDKSDYPGMFVVKPPLNNVEPSENSCSPLQYDGLKLLVPPNVGSLIIDNSQMNQELDVTVQTNNPDVDSQQTIENNVEIHLEEPLKLNKDVLTDKQIKFLDDSNNIERIKGKDTIITIAATGSSALQHVESGSWVVEHGGRTTATGGRSLDIVKSIVYGGLIELIASLSVVSSSVGAGAATLNVLALGLANIFGGLIVIGHDLWDLKNEPERGSLDEQEDRYQQLLGRRADFPLHIAISLLSFLVFGFLPPIIYGFSFRERDLKLLTVAAASVVCIIALAAGKAYVQRPTKSYFKTIAYYVMLGLMVSGVSYLFGGLIMKLLEKLHVFLSDSGSIVNPNMHGATTLLASY